MPVVCGAFGEMNKDTHVLIIKCAKHPAAHRDNLDITPEEVASTKGSSYSLIFSQFRRAFGCLAMRVAADEKLRKIMLIRSSRFEENQAAQNSTSNHRSKFNPRSPGWYDNFRNETFHDAFYRYRTPITSSLVSAHILHSPAHHKECACLRSLGCTCE